MVTGTTACWPLPGILGSLSIAQVFLWVCHLDRKVIAALQSALTLRQSSLGHAVTSVHFCHAGSTQPVLSLKDPLPQ